MTEAEEQQLVDEHADLLGDYRGFAVGSGWYRPLNSLFHNIRNYVKNRNDSRNFAMHHNLMLSQARLGDWTIYDQKHSWVRPENLERHRQQFLETGQELPVPEAIEMPKIQQIKEKFGGLRVYMSGTDDYIDALVTMTESWCANTCEECGHPGHTRNTGWIRVLCDHHYEQALIREKEYNT